MERLRDIMAWAFVIGYAVFVGAAAYHQHEVLTSRRKQVYTYTFEDVQKQTHIGDDGVTVEGYAGIGDTYEEYEMTDDDIAEEEYMDSLELLAACVEAEAGNQGLEGKRLVADVILNRVDSPDFPDTIKGVITQPYHFTSYWNGSISNVSISDETFEAVTMELEQRSYPSLLFFTADAYSNYGTPWRQVGDHYFSTK
jgi:spore germination cell wall hydrolase CwlJ-like protein